ncbi:SH3 domain-containing protein [Sagittula stellata]|uniref:DNA topoisomerase IV subunit A n=1 Tax=Sagittula stellata (strain ATCC 700073 / DSM 11524 / E-37) TaxID=388399 RepID=A3K971_SAGS3|nr:SH3 domain-containing protein [Sagittula stellata]EBA06243.1 DNA topoisomerase IV subunit A [Sagittula stellata E-37]
MGKIILLTFGVLGWAWYELSGGSAFVAGQNGVDWVATAQPSRAPVVSTSGAEPEAVTRADTTEMHAMVQPAVASPRPSQVKTVYVSSGSKMAVDSGKLALLDAAFTSEEDVQSDIHKVAATVDSVDEAVAAAVAEYRTVTGSRVNLRAGPSTSFDAVTQLLEGEEVEVLDETPDGWVKLRATDGNNIGWMSGSFLTASN